MKVKNIMFSGFMAAVLAGACGAADAATVLASKEFVTAELGKKQDTLTAGTNIAIDPDTNTISSTYEYNDSALSQKVTDLETAVGNAEGGLVKEVAGIKDVIDTLGDAEGVATLTNDVSDLKEAMVGLPADTTVAEAIADAVSDKVTTSGLSTTLDGYTTDAEHTALAGRVTANEGAITGLQNTKADKTALDGYVTTGTLTEYQSTVSTALSGKASTGDLTALDGRVTAAEGEIDTLQSEMDAVEAKALANETAISNLDSTYAKDSDVETAIANLSQEGGAIATLTGTVAGIEADLADVKATADAAQTAQQVKDTVEGYGYQTSAQVESAITAKGYATTTYVDNQDAATLQSAKDSAADLYQPKGNYQTAGNYLEDPEAKGTYLVTRAEDGTISYSAVQVVGANDTIVLQ